MAWNWPVQIEDLASKGKESPVVFVLSVLEDWLLICVYILGMDQTKRTIAYAIDEAYQLATSIV